MSPEEVKEVLSLADSNRDGKLDYTEVSVRSLHVFSKLFVLRAPHLINPYREEAAAGSDLLHFAANGCQ